MSKKNKPAPQQAAQARTGIEKEKKTKERFSLNFKLAFILGLISLVVYANTLKNDYVLDDHVVISDNALVNAGISSIPKILTTPYHAGWARIDNDQYRPLSLVVFAAECQFFGLNPAPGHFVNILLFAGCVILLFLFLNKLFAGKKIAVAFIASLLFALHPIHTEVVANIKGCDDLLCCFFAFLCLNIFIKYVQQGKTSQLLAGSFCFLLALLSKETAITFLAIIPLIFFFYRNDNKKRSVYITVSAALAATLFLVTWYLVLSAHQANHIADVDMIENALANKHISYESRIATAVLILGCYIKLLLIPYPLICDYSYNSIPYTHFSSPAVLLSLAVYIFLIVFSIRRLLKNQKDPYAFGILFFLISISLFSNIPFLVGATMAERFAFFGSVGFCLVTALLLDKLLFKKGEFSMAFFKNEKALAIIVPILLVYFMIIINRNSDWADDATLYKTDLKKAPDDSRLNYYVADELLTSINEEKDPAKQSQTIAYIISTLKKSLAIYPDYLNAQLDLGNAYLDVSLFDSAEVHYKRALQINPMGRELAHNLAQLYFIWKKYPQAIAYNRRTIEISPDYVIAYANIGLCYLTLNQYDSAIYYANKAAALDPKFFGSYKILSSSYKAIGKEDSAAKYETLMQQTSPQ